MHGIAIIPSSKNWGYRPYRELLWTAADAERSQARPPNPPNLYSPNFYQLLLRLLRLL
jgi:hypothetical protein